MKLYQNKNQLKNYTKLIIRKLEQLQVYASFKDNIWGADLADTKLIIKYNKDFL